MWAGKKAGYPEFQVSHCGQEAAGRGGWRSTLNAASQRAPLACEGVAEKENSTAGAGIGRTTPGRATGENIYPPLPPPPPPPPTASVDCQTKCVHLR